MSIEEAIHEFDDAIVRTAHNGRKVGDYDHVVISSDVAAVLQKWMHDVRNHGCYPENDGQTHHATCWRTRGRHECAIKRVEHLESMLSNSEALGCYYNDESMRLQQRVEELEDFARDISDNYDCDTDAHRYRTTCRACKAKKILKGVDAE